MIFKSKGIKKLESRVTRLEETVIKLMLDNVESKFTEIVRQMEKKELKTKK